MTANEALKQTANESPDVLQTPAGWRNIEAYTDGRQVVLLQDPDENDENHNCDCMGCSALGKHVFWRGVMK